MAKTGSPPEQGDDKFALLRAPLISFLLAAVALLILEFALLPIREGSMLELETRKLAQSQANMVGLSLNQFQNRLQGLGETPALLQALSNPSIENIATQSARLGIAFPEASAIQLLPIDRLGITGLRRYNIELRNNIESNMVARAEDGDAVAVEAYNFDGALEYSLAQPITHPSSGKVVGIIIARMPIAYLGNAISTLDADWGKSQLLQSFRKKDLPLVDHGNSNYSLDAASAETIRVDVPGSIWQLAFAPGNKLEDSVSVTRWPLWLNFGIPALLIGLWHFVSLRKLRLSGAKDLDLLTEFTHEFAAGKASRPPVLGSSRLKNLADAIVDLRRQAGQAAKPAKVAAAAEAVNDDALDIQDAPAELPAVDAPANIFRAYDIRGLADTELSDEVAFAIGMAIGSEAQAGGQSDIALAADGRNSSPRIKGKVSDGLVASGMHVIDIGEQPTPILYYATEHLETAAGVMVTGSHNGAECNGIKLVLDGRPLSGEHIQKIAARIQARDYKTGNGSLRSQLIEDDYIDAITSDIAVAQTLKIVVDAGNGITGNIGPALLESLGCEVERLYCDIDGNFPNHAPDPSREENLRDLMGAVHAAGADMGIAFDGDGDRVGVVTASGKMIPADLLLMLFAQDVVSRNPGADIIYDVKCTRHLNGVISSYGGRPIMWKSGHSCIKEKMRETGALLGGEYTGHVCFKERWYGFDDGLYAAARLIEIVTTSGMTLEELLSTFPESVHTPEIIVPAGDSEKFTIIEELLDSAQFGGGKITTLDGIRVDYPGGWGLVRASNTVPAITLRFEADNDEELARIQDVFREQIGMVNPTLASAF